MNPCPPIAALIWLDANLFEVRMVHGDPATGTAPQKVLRYNSIFRKYITWNEYDFKKRVRGLKIPHRGDHSFSPSGRWIIAPKKTT